MSEIGQRRSRWVNDQQNEDEPGAPAASNNQSTEQLNGDSINQASNQSTTQSADQSTAERPRKRSRWGEKKVENAAVLAMAMAATLGNSGSLNQSINQLTPQVIEQAKLQLRIDELTRFITNPTLLATESAREPRSPSPDPIYDQNGVRTNTREARKKTQFTAERATLINQLTALNPSYKPPSDFKKQTKFERKLYIPVKQYPDYNFIGLILGPRGATQKQMERETGCKIVIRGKGSSKDSRSKPDASDNDEIHVLVMGDNEEQTDKTAEMIRNLLIPIDDAGNEHKTKQLRELALINGTLRDEVECRICGGQGHRSHVCPQRQATWKPAFVKCNICGQTTHTTNDCPYKDPSNQTNNQSNNQTNGVPNGLATKIQAIDEEYQAFMDELSGGTAGIIAAQTKPVLRIQDGDSSSYSQSNNQSSPQSTSQPNSALNQSSPQSHNQSGSEAPVYRITNPNISRVGDGTIRHIHSLNPRENAREFRPHHSAQSSYPPAQSSYPPNYPSPSSQYYPSYPPPAQSAYPNPPMNQSGYSHQQSGYNYYPPSSYPPSANSGYPPAPSYPSPSAYPPASYPPYNVPPPPVAPSPSSAYQQPGKQWQSGPR